MVVQAGAADADLAALRGACAQIDCVCCRAGTALACDAQGVVGLNRAACALHCGGVDAQLVCGVGGGIGWRAVGNRAAGVDDVLCA